VDDRAETSLALHNNVRDTHLAAESGEEDDELDRVDVVRDDDEAGLLGLNESDTVVEAVLDEQRLLVLSKSWEQRAERVGQRTDLVLTVLGSGLGRSLETRLLLLLGLRAVLVQQLEELSRRILVERVGELSDGRWDLQALGEDRLLALEANVLRPLDEAGKVGLVLDVLA
jgi:hypothetical protein